MKTTYRALAVLAMLAAPAGAIAGEAAKAGGPITAAAAFESLKKLAGPWDGHVMTPDGPPGSVVFDLTGGGSALRERMFPDTPHEMMNVYYLEGDDLVLTHYCHGNQPRFKLSRAASTPEELVFEFAGGSNIDPAQTAHMHAARIRLAGETLREEWDSWQGGRKADTKTFYLARRK